MSQMKTDVEFENAFDFFVKLCLGIEENDEKILEDTQDEVSAPQKEVKIVP